MRIKNGVNHVATYELYYNMPEKKRREIFNIFCETNDLYGQIKAHSRSLKQRKLTDEQALMFLANEEYKITTKNKLGKKFGVSGYVGTLICKGQTYKDCKYKYEQMNEAQKQKIVSLLREEQV